MIPNGNKDMDLVDIDQVLNNLELREEEAEEENNVPQVAVALSSDVGKKSFLSQVFDSLDDFRNEVSTLEEAAFVNNDESITSTLNVDVSEEDESRREGTCALDERLNTPDKNLLGSNGVVEDLTTELSSISISLSTSVNSDSRFPTKNGPDVEKESATSVAKESCSAAQKQTHSSPPAEPIRKEETQTPSKPQHTIDSTMDEISDADLDSMLQEMDIEDAISPHFEPVVPKTSPAASVDVLYAGGGDNGNSDSFSQASTVELSEMKAIPLPPERLDTVPEPNSPNCINSSYTSSSESSSLDNRPEDVCFAENLDAQQGAVALGTRPRPTTLDLPHLCSHEYMCANAGQTPPGQNAAAPDCSTQQLDGAVGNSKPLPTDDKGFCQEEPEQKDGDDNAATQPIKSIQNAEYNKNLGKVPPIWVPDNMAVACMACATKFTIIKRRHHCRACGKVLCSLCCSQKYKLDFVATNPESRVCVQCFLILTQREQSADTNESFGVPDAESDVTVVLPTPDMPIISQRSPNPNNPMEYCSTIPPHRQMSTVPAQPPSVIVPVGVLKKDGSHPSKSSNSNSKHTRKRKSVMFSDGIAPGSDLANIDHQWGEPKHAKRGQQPPADGCHRSAGSGDGKPSTSAKEAPQCSNSSSEPSAMGLMAQLFRNSMPTTTTMAAAKHNARYDSNPKHLEDTKTVAAKGNSCKRLPPSGCDKLGCFIPKAEHSLPPLYVQKDDGICDYEYKDIENDFNLMQRLQHETLKFALHQNLFVLVKIVNLNCCMNRTVINFTTIGMHQIGNDEIVILLECLGSESKEETATIPKDIFVHIYDIYRDAEMGQPITELSFTSPKQSNFLGTKEYGGFIFIRATFQCLQDVLIPENPFLIGILIHRYEVPWAKVFPLRLMLRLGAQYRYYPCPHISMRNRESVYAEIAQTIINFLADFRNYTYTLPCIRGMYIHMEDRQTTVLIPRNRRDDVIKAISHSSDHILAFAGNFSKTADGHLVCIQNVNDQHSEMYAYSTQAINIQGQPRKVTGTSFIVLNEALKSNSGLSGKCSIVEDGLMVQILPAKMEEVRAALHNQKDISIVCGPLNAEEQHTEIVKIKWVANDRDFNIGVKSPIDEQSMEGVSSMRVHASFNYSNANYAIRLTDIYVIKHDDWYNLAAQPHSSDTVATDVTHLAEQLAKSASLALVPLLDLLAATGSVKIGLRATLHQDNVCYEAGTRGAKMPPLYMNALDNHLIPTLHAESSGITGEPIILELIFYILNA